MTGVILQAVGWAFLPILALPAIYLLLPNGRLLGFVSALVRSIDAFIHGIGEIVKWALPLLVLSVAASVFALSIFGTASVKWLESAFYFQAVIIMLGAAATLLASQHVRVDVFHAQMSPTAKARVDLLGYYMLLAPVCLLLLWKSQSFVGFAWMTLEGSAESDGIRGVFLLKSLIPAFAITMLMQGLAIALRATLLLKEQPRPVRPEAVPDLFPAPKTDPS